MLDILTYSCIIQQNLNNMTQELSSEARWAIESSDRMRKLRRSYWTIKILQVLAVFAIAGMTFWAGHDYATGLLSRGINWTIFFPLAMFIFLAVFMLSFKIERLRLQLKEGGDEMRQW